MYNKRQQTTLVTTQLAKRRQQQLGISNQAILATLSWGHQVRQMGGRVAYHLGRRPVAHAERHGVNLKHHQNTAVIVSPDGTIVTVFRRSKLRRCYLK